jgi:hypothetical protein
MSELKDAAATLKNAFDSYVDAISEASDDPAYVILAMNELHAAVRQFTDASIDACGWGNPFILPLDEDGESRPVSTSDVVSVEASYRLRITNEYTFRQFVVDRVRKAGGFVHGADTPASQLHELFAVDGWDPLRYRRDDLEVLQSRWSVSNDNV